MAEQTQTPGSHGVARRHRLASLVAGVTFGAVAAVFVVGGAWALWADRVDRDSSGFMSIGTTNLHTDTYALVGTLRGDGPRWLWGATVLGTARVRATSNATRPLFVGIARTSDVDAYLNGAGYAAIDHLASNATTPHAGHAPPTAPGRSMFWVASTQGTAQQTLRWKPRAGDWSIVLMNADASSGVAITGDIGAKVPLLPWLALGLLAIGATLSAIGGWLIVHSISGPLFRLPSMPEAPRDRGWTYRPARETDRANRPPTSTERVDVHGAHLAQKVKELVHEGNVSRVVIKDPDGEAVFDMPVTVGVVGAMAAPKLATLAALAAMAKDYSVEVEREHPTIAEPTVTAT